MSRTLASRVAVLASGAFFLAFGAAHDARALVDGNAPTLAHKHTVQGNAVVIGNTVLATTQADAGINSVVLPLSATTANLSSPPADATITAAYLYWSGSLRTGD